VGFRVWGVEGEGAREHGTCNGVWSGEPSQGLGFGLCCGRDKLKKKKKKPLNFTSIETMSSIEYLLTFFLFSLFY